MFTKEKCCIICNKPIISKVNNKKTCSKDCFKKHRKAYALKRAKIFVFDCKYCGKENAKYKIGSGFCNKSCASKFYYENGTYKYWQQAGVDLNKEKKLDLIEIECVVCKTAMIIKDETNYYSKNKKRARVCSRECQAEYTKQNFSGENSFYYGKTLPDSTKQKVKDTLNKKYGVSNAYMLAKNRNTVSRPQLELFNILQEHYNSLEIVKEQYVNTTPKQFYADILFVNQNIIVEYNGDFWHANPNRYAPDYLHPKKQILAKDIWQIDKNRLEILQNCNYSVFVIWEHDFLNDKENTVNKLIKEIDDELRRRESIDPRSCIA